MSAIIYSALLLAVFLFLMLIFIDGEGRPAYAILSIIGIGFSLFLLMKMHSAEEKRKDSEIAAYEYDAVFAWKGLECGLDAMIAKAMADGRITETEYQTMTKRMDALVLRRSRERVNGMRTGLACRTRGTPPRH